MKKKYNIIKQHFYFEDKIKKRLLIKNTKWKLYIYIHR